MYTEVTCDLFCIANRLKDVNGDYRVFWNNRDFRFEIHTSTIPNVRTLGFVVPFERLDSRTLEYAQKTLKQNADVIEAEVNAHNETIGEGLRTKMQHARLEIEDMLDYADKTSHAVTFTKQMKWF